MDLLEHYNRLYEDSMKKITSGSYQIDSLIDSAADNRFGITLLIRPDKKVKERIREFINDLSLIEPDQYYYPDSDIHVTVMSIISCYSGFDLSTIARKSYIDIIEESISGHARFEIKFKGVTASPSCILIQGFLDNESLNEIRDTLRVNFGNSNLEQSIDKRYSIHTAHSTVVRFRKPISKMEEFTKMIDRYRDFDFGSFTVDSFELVYNDWYQRKEFVKRLHRFDL